MESYKFTRLVLTSLVLTILFYSCTKDEGEDGLLTEDTGIIPPRFDDSWGYLEAYKILFPINTNEVADKIDYSYGSLVADAFFLPSAGSSKFDESGGGDVYLNGSPLSNLYGSYLGGSIDATVAKWEITGNEEVAGFIDSCTTFTDLTGLTIPAWSACSPAEDLTITLHGNTNDAYLVYVECESAPQLVYGDDKFITKKIQPGTMTCTITAEELKVLQEYYNLGFTLAVEAYTYKKTTSGGKTYYMNNSTRLTHAVYFERE